MKYVFAVKNKINIFKNKEELNNASYLKASEQSPVERLRETVQLILRVYALEPKKPNTNRIYFHER